MNWCLCQNRTGLERTKSTRPLGSIYGIHVEKMVKQKISEKILETFSDFEQNRPIFLVKIWRGSITTFFVLLGWGYTKNWEEKGVRRKLPMFEFLKKPAFAEKEGYRFSSNFCVPRVQENVKILFLRGFKPSESEV